MRTPRTTTDHFIFLKRKINLNLNVILIGIYYNRTSTSIFEVKQFLITPQAKVQFSRCTSQSDFIFARVALLGYISAEEAGLEEMTGDRFTQHT